MNENTCNWGIFWKVSFVNYANIILNAINDLAVCFKISCVRNNLNNCVLLFSWFKKSVLMISLQIHYCDSKIFEWPNFGPFFLQISMYETCVVEISTETATSTMLLYLTRTDASIFRLGTAYKYSIRMFCGSCVYYFIISYNVGAWWWEIDIDIHGWYSHWE